MLHFLLVNGGDYCYKKKRKNAPAGLSKHNELFFKITARLVRDGGYLKRALHW